MPAVAAPIPFLFVHLPMPIEGNRDLLFMYEVLGLYLNEKQTEQ